jgi:taurine dioxygenase
LRVEPSGQACGARVTGIDLSQPLGAATTTALRATWLKYRVLEFADQTLDDDGLESFTQAMGGFGEDPFFAPLPGRKNVAAILREADEQSPLFAENWHSDWSFLKQPPAGTCLLAIDIPPTGGDTLFADQIAAFAALPPAEQARYSRLIAVHSARGAYAPDGTYGDKDGGRSMAIRASEDARATRTHPLVQPHPETGEPGFFSCAGYIVGIEGMADAQAFPLLRELLAWQSRHEFVYRHRWEPGSLVLWDNRSVLHCATGGYEGHRRELHRTTIRAWKPRKAGSLGDMPRSGSGRMAMTQQAGSAKPAVAYKVLTAMQMNELEQVGTFAGAPIDLTDGFIHLSTAEQIDETVAKHFAGQDDLHVAAVDLEVLGDAVHWEPSREGQLFPHIYAALPLSVVIAYGPLVRDHAGRIRLPIAG